MQNKDNNQFVTALNVIQGGLETAIVLLETALCALRAALAHVKAMAALNEDHIDKEGPDWCTKYPKFMAALNGAVS
jgi:hypothetical protein